jgi:hypothetical protein
MPNIVTCGFSHEEAQAMAKEAQDGCLEADISRGGASPACLSGGVSRNGGAPYRPVPPASGTPGGAKPAQPGNRGFPISHTSALKTPVRQTPRLRSLRKSPASMAGN